MDIFHFNEFGLALFFLVLWPLIIFLVIALFNWDFGKAWDKVGIYILTFLGVFILLVVVQISLIIYYFFTEPIKFRIIEYGLDDEQTFVYAPQGKSRLGFWFYISPDSEVKFFKSMNYYYASFESALTTIIDLSYHEIIEAGIKQELQGKEFDNSYLENLTKAH
jgi:hypothetical protein